MKYKEIAFYETKAWKAYYNKNIGSMIMNVTKTVNQLYSLSKLNTLKLAKLYSKAAKQFGTIDKDAAPEAYYQTVLPLLEQAYIFLKKVSKSNWEAPTVAKADLDWMVARRKTETANPEHVGHLMAIYYQTIFGDHSDIHFKKAGYLRSIAARYRDLAFERWEGMTDSDWDMVQSMLTKAYFELENGIQEKITA